MTENAPALQLEAVDFDYGAHRVLDGLDLTVPRGQAVALLGPSGSGKTTLFRLLSGVLRPLRGPIEVLGAEPARLSVRQLRTLRRRIGLLYQNDALIPGLRVVHNVLIGRLGHWSLARSLLSLLFPREVDRAREALRRVGIADKLYESLGALSGGQRQRVALARLLVQDPELILADEPSTSLDPRLARAVVGQLLELSRERGCTVIVSMHDLELLDLGFDRVLGLRDGGWFVDGPPAALDRTRLGALFAESVG